MNIDEPLSLLRQLKGCPLSVLFALAIAHQPVGERWLIQVTGYSQNMVRNALGYLNEISLAQRNGRYDAWVLCDGVRQLPLMAELLPSQGFQPAGESINDSPDDSSSSSSFIVGNEVSMGKKKKKAKRESLNDSPDPIIEELHNCGIMGKKAIDLAKLEWMTIPYIKAHFEKYREGNYDGLGLLICRLECHDPITIELTAQEKHEKEAERYRKGWHME
jgi:hypothetical protein